MIHPSQFQDAIRHIMKAQKRSLYDLAEYLEISYSTAKRIFSEDISIGRIARICEWLGVTLGELESIAAEQTKTNEIVRFTERQEKVLAEDSRYLAYLTWLYGNQKPEKIAEQHGLTSEETGRYIRKLESCDLIRVSPKGKVALPHKDLPRFIKNGILQQLHHEHILKTFHNYFLNQVKEGKHMGLHRGQYQCRPISKEKYIEMAKELDEVIKKWLDISKLEDKLAQKRGYWIMAVARTWSDDDNEITPFTNLFGSL